MQEYTCDVLILGGGPAGYTAALYATRAGLSAIVVERMAAGGQMAITPEIDNYPGFDEGISGYELGAKMQKGAERFGARTVTGEVLSVELSGREKVATLRDGCITAKSVIIATGASPRKLGLSNEEALIGRGVSYCASCDGMFYRDKTVVIVGGGNTAAEDALLLSKVCKKVVLVHRRDTLRASKIYRTALEKAENVEFIWNSTVQELFAAERIQGVRVQNVLTGEEREVSCDGFFISIGRTPETVLFKDAVKVDDGGYILADESTKTNIPGVFAAGDVRTKTLRQIVTAAADGAVAAHFAEEYIAEEFEA